MNKDIIRKTFLKKRLELPKEKVMDYSAKIIENIRKLNDYKNSHVIMLYYPIKNEPDLLPLLDDKKQFLFPKIINMEILPIELKSKEDLTEGFKGIKEPKSNNVFDGSIDIVFVPGIAFDRDLFRIGYGSGFYDRFLSKASYKLAIGVCYDFQIVDKFNHDFFDKNVDILITQNKTFKGGHHEHL